MPSSRLKLAILRATIAILALVGFGFLVLGDRIDWWTGESFSSSAAVPMPTPVAHMRCGIDRWVEQDGVVRVERTETPCP